MDLAELTRQMQAFSAERDWEKFHNPKNLAMALTVETAELLEVFQWLTPEQSANLQGEELAAARDEIGDVLLCLVNLCARIGVEPLAAAFAKLDKVRAKYPIDKAKGLATKYDKL